MHGNGDACLQPIAQRMQVTKAGKVIGQAEPQVKQKHNKARAAITESSNMQDNVKHPLACAAAEASRLK